MRSGMHPWPIILHPGTEQQVVFKVEYPSIPVKTYPHGGGPRGTDLHEAYRYPSRMITYVRSHPLEWQYCANGKSSVDDDLR